MSSLEFFGSTREHLTPNGVMVVNMNLRSDAEELAVYKQLYEEEGMDGLMENIL